MAAPLIKIQDASLTYAQKLLFDGLSFTIPGNQWTCLLGPSGVGKTSLLRLISGLTTDVVSKNSVLTSDGKSLVGQVAYLSQQDDLLPWLTVLDNILIGYKLRSDLLNKKALRLRALNLLHQVGLVQAAYLKPAQISGGMKQRVLLARTLMENKPLVLMDEPFASLDAITRIYMQDLASNLLRNCTVLLVTHDPLEALRLGHHILIMSGRPATLERIQLPEPPPRHLADPDVLHWQAEILQKLSHAKGILGC
jgi:putative hydroxymethylpyrimidine transport system ATP-binding protein